MVTSTSCTHLALLGHISLSPGQGHGNVCFLYPSGFSGTHSFADDYYILHLDKFTSASTRRTSVDGPYDTDLTKRLAIQDCLRG